MRKEVVVVFSYAPAGLGHLRVTDALYEGFPGKVTPLLMGSRDEAIKRIHRITSIHPWLRAGMEQMQYGWLEDVFTFWYRKTLRRENKKLYGQVLTLLDQRLEVPRVLLVVATHFGLAHQLAGMKEQLWKERKVKMELVVVVTDDSPQHIWMVEGADIIFVPSETTKKELTRYAKQQKMVVPRFEVVSYPVSPLMGRKLSEAEYLARKHQVNVGESNQIHVSMPLSGAAVGMDFYEKLINGLEDKSDRFVFHIVGRKSVNTSWFLAKMVGRGSVRIGASEIDREVVDSYKEMFAKTPVALEVTKPSEQAFKALYGPRQEGGCVLLFATPVGRQEYDNLDFLRRHNLMPSEGEQKWLWEMVLRGKKLEGKSGLKILAEAEYWRGLSLPVGSAKVVEFIWWCMENGILAKMMTGRAAARVFDEHKHELSSKGVEKVWEVVGERLAELEI